MNLRNKLSKFIFEQHWTIGFIEQPMNEIIDGSPLKVRYVKNMPQECWFADPFILGYDDEVIHVLAEEFNYCIRRGRIAKLTIDRKSYSLISYKIILDLPTHLSFPFIYKDKELVYICPENSASGCWNMYEYEQDSDKVSFVRCLSERPLTDAILTDLFSEKMFISTNIPVQNGNRLNAYNLDDEIVGEMVFDSNVARNGGNWFKDGDKVYRPAQDCNGDYGKALIIQEVQKKGSKFYFKDIRRIESTNRKFTTGCHTFNRYQNMIVIDVHGWRHNLVAPLFNVIRELRHLL